MHKEQTPFAYSLPTVYLPTRVASLSHSELQVSSQQVCDMQGNELHARGTIQYLPFHLSYENSERGAKRFNINCCSEHFEQKIRGEVLH